MDLNIGIGESTEPKEDGRADSAAMDLIKQLLTLSAGVLALSATFLDKLAPLRWYLLCVLAASWFALIVSIYGGLQGLSVIVKSRLEKNNLWSRGEGKRNAQLSKFGFLVGIILFVLFAFLVLLDGKSPIS